MGFLTDLKRLWGEGKIRVEGVLEDGRTFVAKAPYIGDISDVTDEEIVQSVKNEILVEHGARVKTARVVGKTTKF